MADHDNGYKRLFSHPEMIADLLRGFVREELAWAPDLSTLERVSSSYITPEIRSREGFEGDVVWRVRWEGDRGLYVDLLIEFQSVLDPELPLRVMVYVGLDAQWSTSQEWDELIKSVPDGLGQDWPRLRYCLLDESRIAGPELKPLWDLAVVLFQLEESQDLEDIQRGLSALIEWRQRQDRVELMRSFTAWLRGVLLLV